MQDLDSRMGWLIALIVGIWMIGCRVTNWLVCRVSDKAMERSLSDAHSRHIKSLDIRVSALEQAHKEVQAQIASIDVNVEWIKRYLETQR